MDQQALSCSGVLLHSTNGPARGKVPDRRPAPDEEAARNEHEGLARQAVWEVTEFLFRRPDAMKSKHAAVRGLVRVLGIVHGLDADAIQELLREVFPDSQLPAKRTIQLAVEDGWDMLKERFGPEPEA